MSASEASGSAAAAWVGRTARQHVFVSAGMIDAFAGLSGDTAPIHLDDAFARRGGFTGRVAHGLLLGALVSRVIGTELPGPAGILQAVSLSFRNPCYVGDEIVIDLSVRDYIASVRVVRLDVRITRVDGTLLARGQAQSGLLSDDEHGHT